MLYFKKGYTVHFGLYKDKGNNSVGDWRRKLDDIEQDEFNFIYSIELGANFIIPKWNNGVFDLGVRYTMSPKMKPVNVYSYDDLDSQEINKFADKVNADYITIYIGGTRAINNSERKRNKQNKPIGLDI